MSFLDEHKFDSAKSQFVVEELQDDYINGYDGPGWYFWDETYTYAHGPFATKNTALAAASAYAESLTNGEENCVEKG